MPDLILLDIGMPGMDGWEFLDHYRNFRKALPKKIKIYMCTSSVNDNDDEKARQYDFLDSYLVKPIHKHTLLKILS